MTTTSRRGFIGALAASGATLTATSLSANPAKLDLDQLKKETDVACLYHCDFGDQQRFSQMRLSDRSTGSDWNEPPRYASLRKCGVSRISSG